MTKSTWILALILVVGILSIISSSASAQSACGAGALTNYANSQGLSGDCDTLLSARDTLAGTAALNWASSLPIEQWDGVSVDDTLGRVTGLNLEDTRLDGEIPAELGRLDALEDLYLNANRLTGDIPAELGSLGNLQRLHLNGNHLDGEIPVALRGLTSLRVLSLSQNRLDGGIPSELALLGNLEELYLNRNQLSGEIPSELGGLSSLERLYLHRNQLDGTIPSTLGNLTNLRVLSLSQNQLSGEIPSELGGLTSLQSLYLDGNRLTGEIPAALGALANLQRIRLSGNLLTGCVPHGLLGAVVDEEPLGLPPCEGPATPGSVTVVIALAGHRAPIRINTPIGLTATFSQAVSDFTADDISVAFGTVANFGGSGSNYTFDVTPNAAGPVTVDIPAGSATDAEGNGNTAARQLQIGIPYDDNNDSRTGRAEVIAALRDYFARSIRRVQVIGMLGLYFASPSEISRVANAGSDDEALESSTVMLDGSATTGPAGSISSYWWEQVITGSPLVSLSGADTARPAFTLPELSSDQAFVFRLTVTYNDGDTSQDEVTITGRPTPGVIVSDVLGNTASIGATAEFYLRLRSRPSAAVVIPISSSDESEGVPEQTQVVFTPENWHIGQTVVIRGRNANVQGGVQDYEIILGSSQSSDPFYNGLDIANVEMVGIALEIAAPEVIEPLIANIPATISPSITYTGSSLLSFSLAESPSGMSIDFSLGIISWTPQDSDEGRTFNVTVRANDGALFAEASFQVAVVQPEPIATEIQGNVLTVTDPTTTLNGVSVTAMPAGTGAPVTFPALGKASAQSVPQTPAWINRITDIFVVNSSYDNPVELRFPVDRLPDGVSPEYVNLYAFVDTTEVEGRHWSPVAIERSFEGTVDSPVYVVGLGGLESLAFFGYHINSPAVPSEPGPSQNNQGGTRSVSSSALASIPVTPVDPGDIECRGTGSRINPFQPIDWNNRLCTYSGDDAIRIKVWGFGNTANATRWSGRTSIEELVSWLIEAQEGFESLGLGYDKDVSVSIHNTGSALGYVTIGDGEGLRTLHISDNITHDSNTIKGTAVHEYFHHAQGHNDSNDDSDDTQLVIEAGQRFGGVLGIGSQEIGDIDQTMWIIEGTARWFEDELYDSLNTYKSKEGRGRMIMEAGLDSVNGNVEQRPYQRFSFFKLLTQSCSGLENEFQNLINADLRADPTGIQNLSGLLGSASCNFGDHLGGARRGTLEAAIAYYNYATQFKNDMTLLDNDNEREKSHLDAFRFDAPTYNFTNSTTGNQLNWTNFATGEFELKPIAFIPPAGAYSFKIPEINASLPAGRVVELTVESDREVIVSMTGDNDYFIGDNDNFQIGPAWDARIRDHHTWFSTAVHGSSYTYGDTTCAGRDCLPEIFVTLVNPSLRERAEVKVSFRVRVETTVEPVITSHATGDSVSNRVVSIVGSIPAEARDETGKVVVTTNGIRTETTLNRSGSFTADVVVSLGANKITAQGFNGAIPVTNEEVITIQGVRSSSTGRNALIPSRVVFVLRWDTGRTTRYGSGDRTDIDIYTTDKNGGTIWYADQREGPGSLDFDNIYGFGPEVVSYRETNADVYVNGTFDVDVHYFSGTPSTNYTLDVIVNEAGAGARRSYKYQSTTPLTVSNNRQNRPGGAGSSRFNDILSVSCNAGRVCQVSYYDRSKLSIAGEASSAGAVPSPIESSAGTAETHENDPNASSDYEQCLSELEAVKSKYGSVDWSCNPDG